jgi:CBS domain-containing protein
MTEPPKINCCMKKDVVFVGVATTLGEAVHVMVEKKVGTLPIVDERGMLVGVTTISDIIQIFLPAFVSLVADIDFVKDYGPLKYPSQGRFDKAQNSSVTEIMAEPIAVEDDSSLIRALAIMHKHNLADLPVLKQGKLVGIASRVDIGRAFLVDWSSGHLFDEKNK